MRAIDSVLLLIDSEPDAFNKIDSSWPGLTSKKHNIEVRYCGNGSTFFGYWFTSIATVSVSGNEIENISWFDRARIEIAVKNWFKSATIDMMRVR